MKKIEFKVLDKRLGNEIPLPEYATSGAAGAASLARRLRQGRCTESTVRPLILRPFGAISRSLRGARPPLMPR